MFIKWWSFFRAPEESSEQLHESSAWGARRPTHNTSGSIPRTSHRSVIGQRKGHRVPWCSLRVHHRLTMSQDHSFRIFL